MCSTLKKGFSICRSWCSCSIATSVHSGGRLFPHFRLTASFATNVKRDETGLVLGENSTAKRNLRRKRAVEEVSNKPGFFNVVAFATAESYNMDLLRKALIKQDLYDPLNLCSDSAQSEGDVICAAARYQVTQEPRLLYFFREGSLVMWNIPVVECQSILKFVEPFEYNSYDESIVRDEQESMLYTHSKASKRSQVQGGNICLAEVSDSVDLDKYTFSNAIALSVKLGVWEACLDRYVDSIEYVTKDLKNGRRIRITRGDVLRKTGELFGLRHSTNLSSDLLDTPDFYWDHDQLETLYLQTCSYFNISKRTRVMNEKLNHCLELMELLSSHLSDRHHVRLEWMIIALIMVEVGFEILHYIGH